MKATGPSSARGDCRGSSPARACPVHVHFDLDALDPAEFAHVAYPEGRLSIQAGLAVVRAAAAGGRLVGLTITELAPADERAAEEGSRVLAQICEAAL